MHNLIEIRDDVYAPGWGFDRDQVEVYPSRPTYTLHLSVEDRESIPDLLEPLLLSSVVIAADGGDDWEEWGEPWKGEDNPAALHVLFWVPDGIGFTAVEIARSLVKGLVGDRLLLIGDSADPLWRSKAVLTDGRDWSKAPQI